MGRFGGGGVGSGTIGFKSSWQWNDLVLIELALGRFYLSLDERWAIWCWSS